MKNVIFKSWLHTFSFVFKLKEKMMTMRYSYAVKRFEVLIMFIIYVVRSYKLNDVIDDVRVKYFTSLLIAQKAHDAYSLFQLK